MFGLLGDNLIGIIPFTGPKSDTIKKTARFARHDLLRGKPVFHDLGNDAETRKLAFFFDESFCTPELALRQIEQAFQNRKPLQVVVDFIGFETGIYLIESLTIKRKKSSSIGRLTRVELEAGFLEDTSIIASVDSGPAAINRAIFNPLVKRA